MKLEAILSTAGHKFGDDVEIDGNWIFIGAPKEENAAETDNTTSDHFGNSMAAWLLPIQT